MAQLASVLAWGARGRVFESHHPDKTVGRVIPPNICLYEIMFITYILYSQKSNKFYSGHTCDLNRRLEEHNRGKTAFMAAGAPWTIQFSKEHNTRSEAIKLEKFIKKRGAARFLNDN